MWQKLIYVIFTWRLLSKAYTSISQRRENDICTKRWGSVLSFLSENHLKFFFLILSSETAGELTRTSVCVFGHDPVKYRLLIHQHLEPLK